MVQQRPPRTLGPGHDTFWEWCGNGELRLPRCTACGALEWPITDACRQCGGTQFDWTAMSGLGRVISWCSFVKDYYGGMMPMPLDTILVALDEGVMFLSNPQGFTADDIVHEMPVRVAFIACEDEHGPFSLPVFEKA